MAGKPGYKHSEETKKKFSLAQMGNKKWLGKKHTEETKRKIGLAHKGKKLSDTQKQNLREINLGSKWPEERRLEWSERKKGEGNNNWKGGITPENKRERLTWRYRLWSLAIRERDRKCMECGTTNNLHAHHLSSFIKYKEKQYDLENGITLCAKCHYQKHKIRGNNVGS